MEVLLVGLIAATLRVATPLIFGTMGELLSERAGILNLGIEGTMFLGAFVGFTVAYFSGSLWLGFLVAVLAGVLTGLLMGLLTVSLGLNQHVSGLGMTLFLTGISLFAFGLLFGERLVQPKIDPFPRLSPFGDIPILGPLFEQYALTYMAFGLVPLFWWLIYRTSFGLQLPRGGGEPGSRGRGRRERVPHALPGAGDRRCVDGGWRGLPLPGPARLIHFRHRGRARLGVHRPDHLCQLASFQGVLRCLLFGGVFALQLRLQTTGMRLPYELFLALPYLVTILALTIAGRNASAPAALLKPYRRE